jgi:hypothetical protein
MRGTMNIKKNYNLRQKVRTGAGKNTKQDRRGRINLY